MNDHSNLYSDKPWLKHYDTNVKNTLNYPKKSLVDFFNDATSKYPEQIFLIHREHQFSYLTIKRWVNSLSRNLISLGLQKGDRVAILLPNCPQFIISYYAVLMSGGVVVAINPNYQSNEILDLINKSTPTIIICIENHKLLNKLENSKLIISSFPEEVLESNGNVEEVDQGENQIFSFTDLIRAEFTGTTHEFPEVKPSDAAIFQFSGGTTGIPKAAIGLHNNITANVTQFINWCDLKKNKEIILTAIPLYHVYGMVLAMNMGVMLGSTIILVDDPRNIDYVLDQIEKYQVTFYPGVPAMYHAINQNERVRKGLSNLKSIKACISGSYPLHASIKEEFEKYTGGKLVEGYGLSEAPTATHCNPIYGKNKNGSIGLPLPDVSCRVVNLVTGIEDVDYGDIGELVIKGPQIMAGYYDNPDETKKVLRDGWLYTGDVVRMDSDGYFFVVDRKKSLIKVGGLQVWPNEVEAVINSHPEVVESAVGGVPEIALGEKVLAWVIKKSGSNINSKDIVEWCKNRLASYKIPEEVFFVNELPKTGVGKILRRQLISDYKKKCPKSLKIWVNSY